MKTDVRPTDIRHKNGQITRNGKTYGCHVDLSDDEEPDGCVIDYRHADCAFGTYASGNRRKTRWTCRYWKPVEEPTA